MFYHKHWQNQTNLSTSTHNTVGIFMTIVGFVSLTGNIVVIWALLGIKSLRTSSNILIVNLSVACLIMTIVDLPLYAVASFAQDWIFGNLSCQLYATITSTAGLLIMNSYAAIAIDRLKALTRYKNPNFPRSSNSVTSLSVFVWIYSFFWSIAPVLGWGRYQLDGSKTTCTFDYLSTNWKNRFFILSITAFNFVLPFCLIVFSYFRILQRIYTHNREINSYQSVIMTRRRQFSGEKKTAKTLFITITVFCTSWVPYVIIAMIGQFGNQAMLTPQLSVVPQLVAKMSTVTNPILYSLSHPVVRKKIFVNISHRFRQQNSYTESSDKGIQIKSRSSDIRYQYS